MATASDRDPELMPASKVDRRDDICGARHGERLPRCVGEAFRGDSKLGDGRSAASEGTPGGRWVGRSITDVYRNTLKIVEKIH